MKIQTVRQKISFGIAADKESNRQALARLKARMAYGDLREDTQLRRQVDTIVELTMGVRP